MPVLPSCCLSTLQTPCDLERWPCLSLYYCLPCFKDTSIWSAVHAGPAFPLPSLLQRHINLECSPCRSCFSIAFLASKTHQSGVQSMPVLLFHCLPCFKDTSIWSAVHAGPAFPLPSSLNTQRSGVQSMPVLLLHCLPCLTHSDLERCPYRPLGLLPPLPCFI